jgi:hypothetical protein
LGSPTREKDLSFEGRGNRLGSEPEEKRLPSFIINPGENRPEIYSSSQIIFIICSYATFVPKFRSIFNSTINSLADAIELFPYADQVVSPMGYN